MKEGSIGSAAEQVPGAGINPDVLQAFLNSKGQVSEAMATLGDFEVRESGRRGDEIYFKGTRKYGDGFEVEIVIRKSPDSGV